MINSYLSVLNWLLCFRFFYLLRQLPCSNFNFVMRMTQRVWLICHTWRVVFKIWNEGDILFQVKIDPETNALVWSDTTDQPPSLHVPPLTPPAKSKFLSDRQERQHPCNRWAQSKTKRGITRTPLRFGKKVGRSTAKRSVIRGYVYYGNVNQNASIKPYYDLRHHPQMAQKNWRCGSRWWCITGIRNRQVYYGVRKPGSGVSCWNNGKWGNISRYRYCYLCS